jgi:hypothetical protein
MSQHSNNIKLITGQRGNLLVIFNNYKYSARQKDKGTTFNQIELYTLWSETSYYYTKIINIFYVLINFEKNQNDSNLILFF